jgi:Domain of unknown function (DUF4232)
MSQKRIRGGLAITIGFILAACQARTGSSGSQLFSQSETVVVTAKAATQPNYQATLTASPGATPSPTPPSGVPPCDTAYLTASATSEDAGDAITFSIINTNQGPATCKLQGWPQVQIVDQQGEPLVLQAIPFCFECSLPDKTTITPGPSEQTAEPSVAPATIQAILQTPVILAAGKSAHLFLIWRNWCPPFPTGGVNLLMTLSGGSGELTIPTDTHSGGRCDAPTAGATLSISQFLP